MDILKSFKLFEIFAYKNISLIKEKISRNGFKTEEYSFKKTFKNAQKSLKLFRSYY